MLTSYHVIDQLTQIPEDNKPGVETSDFQSVPGAIALSLRHAL